MLSLIHNYTIEARGLNRKSVFGSRLMGKGRTGIETICAILDLPPPVADSSYSDHNKEICGVMAKHAESEQKAAVSRLREACGAEPDDIVDVTVTFDGTWSKRGFTAQYGVCVVISWVTGEVLDVELMSKYCSGCALYKGSMEGEEYEEWLAKHKLSCTRTHFGSSPAMELEGARKIFARSISKYKLRYSTVISDGDSKTVNALNEDGVYGDVKIVKHECVGHVQKRVVTNLKKMKSNAAAVLKETRAAVKAAKAKLETRKAELQSSQGRGRGVSRGRGRSQGRGSRGGSVSSRGRSCVGPEPQVERVTTQRKLRLSMTV